MGIVSGFLWEWEMNQERGSEWEMLIYQYVQSGWGWEMSRFLPTHFESVEKSRILDFVPPTQELETKSGARE